MKRTFFDLGYQPLANNLKKSKYLLGTKIMVKKYVKLKLNKDIYYFLGAWNFKNEIFIKEKDFIKNGGKFITHIP